MSTPSPLSSSRDFQVWEYQVSHGHLLVRSPKKPASQRSPEQTTNLDIHFWGVEYLELPRHLKGIEIMLPNQEELTRLEAILSRRIAPKSVTVLLSGGCRFIVVSSGLKISENEWDIFESPIEFRPLFRNSPPPTSDL
jgi:hypothetical protein